jgi:hypothetical protein
MKGLQRILIGAFLALLGASFAAHAQVKRSGPASAMYKCKDAQGRTYYADKLGPECVGGVQELSRQGLRVHRPAPAGASSAETTAAAPVNLDRERRDKALLATYSSEEQIEAAKQRNLALPVQAIKQAESKLERARKELHGLQAQADGYAGQKKQIPASLLEDVRSKEALVARLAEELQRKREHVAGIEQRFEADKQRFRELSLKQAAR